MSRLDSTVVILIVQITIPLTAALVLSLRRSHWASSRSLAWGAAAVLLLTPCAFLPMPSWSFPTNSPSVPNEETADIPLHQEKVQPLPLSKNAEASAAGIDLSRLVTSLQFEPTRFQSQQSPANDWLTYGIISLAGLGLVRFGIGWISLIWTHRQSLILTDRDLQTMLAELCAELGCRKPIELRESSRIGSAATIGWFRSTILLSTEWRTWTTVEQRAILAHEIGHVLRRDFLSRFLARLAGAIHGYHPLVRCLIRRLELRQELAADAMAAPCVGGSSAYLRCLASLALKADAAPVAVAPPFFSRPHTLLRRIAMLQVMDDKRIWSAGWWSAVIVGALSVLALGLHGQAPETIAAPEKTAPLPAAEPPALDISLLELGDNPDNVGLYTINIGKLLKLPGMSKIGDEYSAMLAKVIGVEFLSNFGDIEQIAGRAGMKIDKDKPAPNHSLMFSLSMIRFKHDHDWATELAKAFTQCKTCKHSNETYYDVEPPKSLQAVLRMEKTMNLYPIDGRTLLFGESETTIRKIIDGKNEKTPKPKWFDQWRQVEQDTFAIVLTDVEKRFKEKLAAEHLDPKMTVDEKAGIAAMEKIFSKCDTVVMSLDLGKSLSLKVRLNASTAEDLPMISEQCESIWKLLKSGLAADSPSKDGKVAEHVTERQILLGLLKTPSMHLADKCVMIESDSKEAMEAINKAIQGLSPMK